MFDEPLINGGHNGGHNKRWDVNTVLLVVNLLFLTYLTIFTILVVVGFIKEESSILDDLYSVYGSKDQLLLFANKTRILVDYGCDLIPACKNISI